MISFIESITTGPVEIPPENEETPEKPQIEVPVDLKSRKMSKKAWMRDIHRGNWILFMSHKYL